MNFTINPEDFFQYICYGQICSHLFHSNMAILHYFNYCIIALKTFENTDYKTYENVCFWKKICVMNPIIFINHEILIRLPCYYYSCDYDDFS